MKKYVLRSCMVDVFNDNVFTTLYSVVAVCAMIVVISQIGLKNETVRKHLTDIDIYEGAYFEVSSVVESPLEYPMFLEAYGENFDGAEIWVNGEKYSALIKGINEVKINNTSVIEIYSPKNPVRVLIADLNDNLISYTTNDEIYVENGLKLLSRIGIK